MKILIVERDREEVKGIEWYLRNYFMSDIEVIGMMDSSKLPEVFFDIQPQVLLIEMELVSSSVEQFLHKQSIPIIGVTAEPIFQQAMKAIRLKAIDLFVKPIPLEQLKSALLQIPPPKQAAIMSSSLPIETQLYSDLYLNKPETFSLKGRAFFLIECANYQHNLTLYEWLIDLPIFHSLIALPLQNRVICIVEMDDFAQLVKQLRIMSKEWEKFSDEALNIAVYDGEETTLLTMYQACKKTLAQRFYKGYSHIFKSSQTLHVTRLDPLLTPEEQQLWITSLENGDLKAIKDFLYALTHASTYYRQDDVRIHLTSILAQIRRFMMKYHLQQQAKIEEPYRALFHFILEHPILYAIIHEFILFTQLLMEAVKNIQQQSIADYVELAVEMIEHDYKNPELTLQLAANELNISANYLSNIFSKKRGIPFRKFLQQHRVQQAEKLLMETNMGIAAVAEMVGFTDSNYFTKVFREYYHLTPYRYRLQMRNMPRDGEEV
ncbi:helix-turn-helix domain-containing protein [Solibacillus silvestris]|uniref:helix-turn-helix domain-containing protein n=1 Tax=Solibacillus silvestris TaxID=76853 RepID=UPI003F817C0C